MGWYGPVGGVLDYSFVELMLDLKSTVRMCNWRHKLFRTNVEDLIPAGETRSGGCGAETDVGVGWVIFFGEKNNDTRNHTYKNT
jgi:hypothetical protein